jgi:hypothetical protein
MPPHPTARGDSIDPWLGDRNDRSGADWRVVGRRMDRRHPDADYSRGPRGDLPARSRYVVEVDSFARSRLADVDGLSCGPMSAIQNHILLNRTYVLQAEVAPWAASPAVGGRLPPEGNPSATAQGSAAAIPGASAVDPAHQT